MRKPVIFAARYSASASVSVFATPSRHQQPRSDLADDLFADAHLSAAYALDDGSQWCSRIALFFGGVKDDGQGSDAFGLDIAIHEESFAVLGHVIAENVG